METKSESQPQGTAPALPAHGSGFRLASAQLAPKLGDLAANLRLHLDLIQKADWADCDLIVFPELSLTGYFVRDLVPDLALRLPNPLGGGASPELVELLAATHEVGAIVGCIIEGPGNQFYNASLYLHHGQILHIHRKVYLPTYGIFDEARFFAAGDRFRSFSIEPRHLHPAPFRTGVLICEDLWHPEAASALARQGLDLLLVQSSSPGRGVNAPDGILGTEQSYAAMLSVNAQLHTTFVAYVNRVGAEEGMLFWGGSRILGPDGLLLAEPMDDQPHFAVADLDPHRLRHSRINTPLIRDARYDVTDKDATYARKLAARD